MAIATTCMISFIPAMIYSVISQSVAIQEGMSVRRPPHSAIECSSILISQILYLHPGCDTFTIGWK